MLLASPGLKKGASPIRNDLCREHPGFNPERDRIPDCSAHTLDLHNRWRTTLTQLD